MWNQTRNLLHCRQLNRCYLHIYIYIFFTKGSQTDSLHDCRWINSTDADADFAHISLTRRSLTVLLIHRPTAQQRPSHRIPVTTRIIRTRGSAQHWEKRKKKKKHFCMSTPQVALSSSSELPVTRSYTALHRATPKAEKTPHRRKTTNTAQLLLTS